MASVPADVVPRMGTDCDDDESRKSGISDLHVTNNFDEVLLHDLDSYLEDIDDRLTISRMVSDSIIKGMVNAVSQEAAEIVAVKELEVASLKEVVCRQQCSNCELNASTTLRKHSDVHWHEHRAESLGLLNRAVEEQLKRLGQCVANTKELGGNAEESLSIKNDLDETFCCLKALLKGKSQEMDVTTVSPESYDEEWKVEVYIRKEVETMVFCTMLQGLQGEYEKQLWNVSIVRELIDRFIEISSLRNELESIQKLFYCAEVGNLSAQGSMEMDHLHRKVSGNHSHLWNENITCEESKYNLPEHFETSPLKHMKATELYQHFRTVITEMKREHESTVQQMTEEYFSLKREYLKERELVKERGPFVAFKKDKDFDILKKDITDAIAKLDEIVKENEKLSEFCNHSRDTLDSLLSENFRLKDILNKQKLEALHFSSQASDATKKLLQHSRAEENLNKLVGDLKCALWDKHIEASISEDVYKCIIREMDNLINSSCGDLDLISAVMQDIFGTVYGEAYHAGVASILDNGDSNLLSSIEGQISEVVFQQVVEDMSMEVNGWIEKCLKKDELLDLLQSKNLEIKNEVAEKDDRNVELKHQVLVLQNIITEKESLSIEISTLHEKQIAQLSEERNKLREQEAYKSNELVLLKHKLEDFEKQIENLNMELKLSQDKLRKSDEETINLTSDLNHKYLASIEAKDNEHIKNMETLSHVIEGLSKSFADFELRINESIGWQSVRLENSAIQLHSIIPKVNVLRRTSSLYTKRLEKRSSDLQKAEAEVDLLGDEVNALLSLLDKIHVALVHYSPILKHYPGIMEILKLVKRELRRDSLKGHLTAT